MLEAFNYRVSSSKKSYRNNSQLLRNWKRSNTHIGRLSMTG